MGYDTGKQGAIVSNQCGLFNRFTDTACTLMARDYKGLGNQAGNGVITKVLVGGDERVVEDVKYEETENFDNDVSMSDNDTGYRIRKLTPKECFRLMGLKDDDFEKAKKVGVSDSQLYKQAGNGIITNCCELLAEHLYKAQYDNTYVCTDENFTSPLLK